MWAHGQQAVVAVGLAGASLHQSACGVHVFFGSLAEDQKGNSIGVILSGAASDGTLGLGAIKAQSGITFAQDDTAAFDGMPRSAVAAGVVDFVLPPKQIAAELAAIARHPYQAIHRTQNLETEIAEGGALTKLMALLRISKGIDFSQYKSPTPRSSLATRLAGRSGRFAFSRCITLPRIRRSRAVEGSGVIR